MLNYIRAELYKAVHRVYFRVLLGLVLVGECLLVWIVYTSVMDGNNDINFFSAIQLVPRMLILGVFAAHLTSDMVFAGQYKSGTMKNEVSFGLSRLTIYFGKLIAMTLVSLIIMAVAMVFYSGLSWFIFDHSVGAAAVMGYLGLSLLSALPIWLGMQALICALSFMFNSVMAAEISALALFFGPSFVISDIVLLLFIGNKDGNDAIVELLAKIVNWLPDSMLNVVYAIASLNWDTLSLSNIQWGMLADCWIVGAFWMIVPTALGLYFFRKKEIT